MLSPQLLEVLVRIGEAGRVDSGSSDNALRVIGDGSFMRQLPQTWDQMALSMSDQQIEALIKGLTLAEREFSVCSAGSVSPVIWLFRVLAGRRNDEIGELVDWVRANTRNDYLPFGVKTFKGKLLSSVTSEVRPHFAGSASVRVRAVTAHDSFERIVDVPCADHTGGEPGAQIESVPDLIRNPLITGLDSALVARSALKDADLQEFTRFYLERRAQEIASGSQRLLPSEDPHLGH